MSKDSFKKFASFHPELVSYIKNGEMTWQKFYEIYDIYGEDSNAWDNYIKKDNSKVINNFQNILNNINTDSIQKHINTAQKAIGVVQELTDKTNINLKENISKIINPRPINKIYED